MGKLRVLVAEDHESMRRALVLFLSCEFEVLGAVADGRGLIESAISLNPDVIVSDVTMPRLTGPQAMNELSARGLHIPFVFVSAGENIIGQRASFVAKADAWDEIVPAVQTAASGRIYSSRRAL